jgi:hypothetical protein
VATTVIAERLRPQGFAASPTILKDHLRQVRPASVTAASYQRTSYLPGELARGRLVAHRPSGADWQGPYARGVRAGGSLPASAALRVMFTLAVGPPSTARRCWAAWSVWVAAEGAGVRQRRRDHRQPRGGLVRLVDEVDALYGALGCGRWSCDPGSRRARGRLSGRSVTWRPSFLPLRSAGDPADPWAPGRHLDAPGGRSATRTPPWRTSGRCVGGRAGRAAAAAGALAGC